MNFRLYFSYAFFYLRVGLVALIVLPVRLLLALLPPARRYGTEAALLQRCNRLFRRIVPVEPYLKRDSYYAYLDTADFRTLCRRLSLPDDWFVGKRLLDVGCGHGKLSRLLALSGAAPGRKLSAGQPQVGRHTGHRLHHRAPDTAVHNPHRLGQRGFDLELRPYTVGRQLGVDQAEFPVERGVRRVRN